MSTLPTKNILTFQGVNGQYSIKKTQDGSNTLYSDSFQEACHSSGGAYSETLYNFIDGCQLEKLAESEEEIFILEVGFGTGLGYNVTKEFLDNLDNGKKIKLHFYSLELDPALVEWAKEQPDKSDTIYPQIKGLEYFKKDGLIHYTNASQDGSTLTVIIGNATDSLPRWLEKGSLPKFHAIFQDPFSPKKNPELWSEKWFTLLKSCSDQKVILSTYSASSSVREAMKNAGWKVTNRKGFAQKRSSTVATLSDTI